ncbi:MAG: hypothetical protein ACK2UW_23510 [Anaerolineales bacterium]|jgi:hypothetical protein
MHKRIVLLWIGFIGLALACNTISNLPSQGERNAKLEGEFDVYGVNPDGSQYMGSAEIVYERGNYVITWEIAGDTVIGSGKWENNEFTVVYDGGRAVYTLNEFGTLTGTWFLEGDSRPGTETLAPMTLPP